MSLISELEAQLTHTAALVAPSTVSVGRDHRGAGVVVAPGKVLTNAHNLRDRTVQITFDDGRVEQAKVVGADPGHDLVVLDVDTGDAPALEWADRAPGLGAFNGTGIEGAWTLVVRDLAKGDVGRLTRWELSVTPAPAVTPTAKSATTSCWDGVTLPRPALEPAALASATNFVTIDCGSDGAFAKRILDELIARDIFVRMPFVAPHDRCIRVSCGRPQDLARFATERVRTTDVTTTGGNVQLLGLGAAGT